MKRFFQSEIGAAVIWVVCSLVMAAVIVPWLYQGGKHLAAEAETKDLPLLLEWLGAACGRAKIGRFFDRALLISALGFLPMLWRRINALRAAGDEAQVSKTQYSRRSALRQIAVGCTISASMLLLFGMLMDASGAFVLKAEIPRTGRIFSKILFPAVGASLLEEWLFRGVLLGLWLRFARPAVACVGTSLLFAFLHFLEPPASATIANPGAAFAGFELLGKILLHLTDPLFFVTDFATLTVVGLILAWARMRTGALWFSIGLHSGWILAFQGFGLFYQKVPGHPLSPWGVGDSLRSGVLPLFTLGLTAVVFHLVTKRFPSADLASHDGDYEDFAESGAAKGGGAFVDR